MLVGIKSQGLSRNVEASFVIRFQLLAKKCYNIGKHKF